MNGMENKLELFFVRHGETEWNKEGRLQGWLDSGLTSEGIRQIHQLKERLKSVRFDAAFSSPSQRAYDTAKMLAGDYLTIEKDPRLLEIHLGSWQGKRIAEIRKEDPTRFEQYFQNPGHYTPDSGESFQQVMDRMDDFVQFCENSFSSGKILAVSHGVAIRAVILSVMQLSIHNLWDFEIAGASVTKILIENGRRTVEYIGKTFDEE